MKTRQWIFSLTCALAVIAPSSGTCPAALADDVPATSEPVEVIINAGKTYTPISPYIYGMFVEHIRNIINGNMWAEMLDDRKFYHPITAQVEATPAPAQPAGGGRSGIAAPRRWIPVGSTDAITMDSQHAYCGDHSPAVSLSPTEPRGIRQKGIALIEWKSYTGRIVLAGDPKAQVTVSLVWGSASTDRQSLAIDNLTADYAKFPLTFHSPVDTADGQLEITATGQGVLRIGGMSLMPADNIHGWKREVIAVLKSHRSGTATHPQEWSPTARVITVRLDQPHQGILEGSDTGVAHSLRDMHTAR
jgi:alpha-L-arabinofuranosidase